MMCKTAKLMFYEVYNLRRMEFCSCQVLRQSQAFDFPFYVRTSKVEHEMPFFHILIAIHKKFSNRILRTHSDVYVTFGLLASLHMENNRCIYIKQGVSSLCVLFGQIFP